MQSISEKIVELSQFQIGSDGRLITHGKKLVLCHGTFDVVHPGHLEHLRQAKQASDDGLLVVSVTSDRFVQKGPGRPVFDEHNRAEFLASLECVDYVVINDAPTPRPVIELLKPDIFAKGSEYGNPDNPNFAEHLKDKALVESYGGRILLTTGFVASSTKLVNHHQDFANIIRPDVKEYLAKIKDRYSPADIDDYFRQIAGLEVQCIGEQIIDSYIYCEPAGKSAKDSIVTWVEKGQQDFNGGILIAADHLAGIGCKPLLADAGMKPIIKKRYIGEPFHNKVFAVTEAQTEMGKFVIPNNLGMTLITDYGHGLLEGVAPQIIEQRATFLALTCQSNSLNWGFNLLTKWSRADYIVLDEQELRLAYHDRTTPIPSLLDKAEADFSCKYMVVTLGHKGCLICRGHKIEHAPALATNIVDRMGAGDAFLAVTAPFAYLEAPMDLIAFIGSVAAGIKVGKIGNQTVTKQEIRNWVKGLLI